LTHSNFNRAIKIDTSKNISTLAGDESLSDETGYSRPKDGKGSQATFDGFQVMKIDHSDNIYQMSGQEIIRRITPTGEVKTVLKQGCVAGDFEFNIPNIEKAGCSMGLIDGSIKEHKQYLHIDLFDIDDSGNIYYVDTWSNSIRKATPDGVLSTIVRGSFPSR